MSIIHSALKKAETEREKRVEPFNFSIDEIVALAEKRSSKTFPIQLRDQRFFVILTFSILALLVVVSVIGFFISFRRHVPPAPPQTVSKTVAPTLAKHIERPAAKLVPVPSFVAPPSEFRLSGILSSGGSRIATLNDKLVQIGDWVGNAQVIAIEERQVFLERRGKKMVVSLPL